MFFQVFDLDHGMTILEGANGTGKTTIMIGAYVCLMPDLNFLSFQNVTAASTQRNEDKGLYGRLGSGEKSKDELVFSVLDIVTAEGTRHLIGVRLIKKTYPQVALKHFAIKHLDENADLEKLLVKYSEETNEQEILELDDIGRNCLPHGGELVHFRHAKDYFHFLFDNGISPVRLLENDERKQYNQLLNTSLYGGLSRSLQTSLRDYLLPENNKLIASIRDMEQNLLTCRRTRSEIQRNQSVREVIHNVYQTGLDMFTTAFFATRLNSEQLIQKALESRKEKHQSRRQWDELASKMASIRQRLDETEQQLEQKKQELESARNLLENQERAFSIAGELKSKSIEREKQKEIEQRTTEHYLDLKRQTDELRREERELTKQQKETASKLADASEAWEDLAKQVGLYHRVKELLTQSRKLMDSEKITEDNIDFWLEKVETSLESSRQANAETYEIWTQASREKDQFQRYHRILEDLLDEKIDFTAASNKATKAIKRFADLKFRIEDAERIPAKIKKLIDKTHKRKSLQKKLSEADLGTIDSAKSFEKTWQELSEARKGFEVSQAETRDSISQIEQKLNTIKLKIPEIEKKLDDWETFQNLKKQLEDRTTKTFQRPRELANIKNHLEKKLQSLNLEKFRLESQRQETQKRFGLLINEGTTIPGLKNLAMEGYGKLLADRYEDIPLEWSANLESRLGPLINALVVKDIHSSVDELIKSFDRPDELWLVEEDKMEKMPDAREVTDSILVSHGDVWRLNRLPESPVLGKNARNKRIESLRSEVKRISATIEKNSQNIQSTQESLSVLNRILPQVEHLDAVSPLEQLREWKKQKSELEAELEKRPASVQHLADRLKQLNLQIDTLRDCSIHQELLDETELEQEQNTLETELEEVRKQKVTYQQKENLLNELKTGVECLRHVPTENLDELHQKHKVVEKEEERYRTALQTLDQLSTDREYFRFADRESMLKEKQSLNTHLREQLDTVEIQLKTRDSKLNQLSAGLEETEKTRKEEDEKLFALNGQINLLEENLVRLGLDGSEEKTAKARKIYKKTIEEKSRIESDLNLMKANRYKMDANADQIQENKNKAESRLKKQRALIRPVLKEWRSFRRQADEDNKRERLMADYYSVEKKQSVKPDLFWRKVSSTRATLIGKMEKMEDTRLVLERIKTAEPESMDDINQAEDCLFIWRQIHGYLQQVIPIDLQTSDPEKAQEAINQKLESLSNNLVQQEKRLRENVRTIPNHLNTEIRFQKSRIRQLNQNLKNVRFGFLQSIRINIETQPKLKQFLDILPQQLDIFSDINENNVSIESLMVELYEKEVSGKVRGDLLLDYRHYVRMDIEVKREGNENFERVTSTNLSTGESIGVGVAVLIMVLMSWEKKSEALRPAERRNSIRFLLLDESSRLDQKALLTLNDFCEKLDLQLLIAAPSVERTLRGTTHHLTRGYFEGREEVIVRGRGFKSQIQTG